MSRPRLIALLLALGTLLVFLPVGRYQFVSYDDTDYVTENPFVKDGLSWTNVHWAFTAFHAGNWHPLTWISHQLDCELFGLNAGPHHLVNALFHAINAALVFILLWQLTSRLWPSTVVAALFAWHPLHVESVAWIAERKDLLSTFFALLALIHYARFATGQKRLSFWLSFIFFSLGLMSKPMIVTLPFILLLLDFWPLKRLAFTNTNNPPSAASKPESWKLILLIGEKWPFFLLAAVSCVITILAQKSGGAVMSLTLVPLEIRSENAPVALATYLRKFIWPSDLCVIYMLHQPPIWQMAVSTTVLALIFAAAWQWRHARPYFMVGWLWFVGTLIPVIGLVQVGAQSMADRYSYLPSIGLFMAVVFLVADYLAELQTPKAISAGLGLLMLAACIRVTEFQLPFWRNSEVLFRHAISVTKDNLIAMVDLGVALDVQHRFDEALVVYRQAEKLDAGSYFQLHNNLGNILGQLGNHRDSLAEYRIALHEQPDNPAIHNAAGNQLAALKNYDEARAEFLKAEELNPNLVQPHF